ncbi:MAG: hypothetical protein ABI480_05460 [Chitinophagaceae bacterium]
MERREFLKKRFGIDKNLIRQIALWSLAVFVIYLVLGVDFSTITFDSVAIFLKLVSLLLVIMVAITALLMLYTYVRNRVSLLIPLNVKTFFKRYGKWINWFFSIAIVAYLVNKAILKNDYSLIIRVTIVSFLLWLFRDKKEYVTE